MARPLCKFVGINRDWLDVRVPMVWDDAAGWFLATIEHQTDMLVQAECFTPPGKTGYRQGMRANAHVEGGSVSMLSDHPRSKGWTMLTGTGPAAEWMWNLATVAFTVNQANRIDVCLDFMCSQRAFDRMHDDVRAIARDHDRRPHPVGEADWGRTVYVNWVGKKGLEASPNTKLPQYSARLYEKGKEQGQDPDWRRWEVSVRPDKPFTKERAFNLDLNELLGSPAWSRAFLDSIGYTDAVKPDRASPFASAGPVSVDAEIGKDMSAMSHMGKQYGAKVRKLVELVGEEEARRIVETVLFRPVIVQADGTEISGPDLIKREAQTRYGDVFRDDLQRRIHDAGEGGKLYH